MCATYPFKRMFPIVRTTAQLFTALTLFSVGAQAQSGPDSVGQWSIVYKWPDRATHASLLADGKILTWFTGDTNYPGANKANLVTIHTGGVPQNFTPVNNNQSNLFCSGHAFLPDGRLLVTGGRAGAQAYGHSDVNVFDHANNTWQTFSYSDIYARWYASAVTLADGNVLLLAGNRQGSTDPNTLPQIWLNDGSFVDLIGAVRKVENYSMTFVAPDGRVFLAGPGAKSSYLNTGDKGSWTIDGPSHMYGKRASGTAVMYAAGKVLVTAGGVNGKTPLSTAEIIDLNQANPTWQPTGPMAHARRHANATVLPDGKVLVTGGSSSKENNNAVGAILPAEMWDPANGSWKLMASLAMPRIYHSMAILLPDGRVLAGGGSTPTKSKFKDYSNVQIYSPPYLFKSARPVIASVSSSTAHLGDEITLTTAAAINIAKVSLVRNSSVTHSFNMNQRLTFLEFKATDSALEAMIPASSNVVPPGDYMLFIVDADGVPSVAAMLKVLPDHP